MRAQREQPAGEHRAGAHILSWKWGKSFLEEVASWKVSSSGSQDRGGNIPSRGDVVPTSLVRNPRPWRALQAADSFGPEFPYL